MATQTGSYDFKAAKAAHDEAAKTASDYITEITNDGIMVHAEGEGPDDTQAPTGWHISNVLEFIRQGVSRFWIGLKNQGDTTPTVRIGKDSGESRMELDYHSMQLFDADNERYFHVSDLRDSDGFIVETFTAPGGTNVFSLMTYPSSNPRGWATIDGETATVTNLSTSSQQCTVSPTPEEGAVVVIGYIPRSYVFAKAFTFGTRIAAEQVGAMSFCEGIRNVARGEASHAEGEHNVANEYGAHAEGAGCTALGSMAHAEGSGTLAGYVAHAEGQDTTASQTGSHSQNVGTKAAKMAQTALGSYNVADTSSTTTHPSGTSSYGQYAAIIGNGTDDSNRSNALTVDWNGNVGIAGDVQDMSGNAKYLPLSGGTMTGDIKSLYGVLSRFLTVINSSGISKGRFTADSNYLYFGAFDDGGTYAIQYRIPITAQSVSPAIQFRNYENGAWGSWTSWIWSSQASRTANTVLAAPNGSTGSATFRALVPTDCSWLGDREVDDQSGNVSVANTTWVAIASVELAAGVWILNGNVSFASNATGRRYACIHSASPTTAAQRQCSANCNATNGAQTTINLAGSKAPTSKTTYTLYAYQTSGSTLNCTGYLAATRIK